jgi:hypothetical protein
LAYLKKGEFPITSLELRAKVCYTNFGYQVESLPDRAPTLTKTKRSAAKLLADEWLNKLTEMRLADEQRYAQLVDRLSFLNRGSAMSLTVDLRHLHKP